jgi:hypothetical protein
MGIRLPENYTELSDEELLDLKQRIEQELDHVKTQIDRAKVGLPESTVPRGESDGHHRPSRSSWDVGRV